MGDNDRPQSEFNMAISYLNRLNSEFYLATESRITLNAHQWFNALLAIYSELITEIKPEEEKAFDEKVKIINTEVNIATNRNQRNGRNEIPQELYSKLDKFEKDLRRIMKEAGLLTKTLDNAYLALK